MNDSTTPDNPPEESSIEPQQHRVLNWLLLLVSCMLIVSWWQIAGLKKEKRELQQQLELWRYDLDAFVFPTISEYTSARARHGKWPDTTEFRTDSRLQSSREDVQRHGRVDSYRVFYDRTVEFGLYEDGYLTLRLLKESD